jgi:uncharacterized membrane protein YeaQ/YmgE (transglycosylase-associated protein family)
LHFVGLLLFGMLIGVVIRMLVAGKAGSWAVSTLSGFGGAVLGGVVGRAGSPHGSGDSAGFVTSLLGAFTIVAIYHALAARRRRA